MIAGNRYHIEQNDLDTWNNNGLDTRKIRTVDYVICAENRNIDASRVQVHNNNYLPSFNDNYNNWKILVFTYNNYWFVFC